MVINKIYNHLNKYTIQCWDEHTSSKNLEKLDDPIISSNNITGKDQTRCICHDGYFGKNCNLTGAISVDIVIDMVQAYGQNTSGNCESSRTLVVFNVIVFSIMLLKMLLKTFKIWPYQKKTQSITWDNITYM
ncbi:hypothetical protein RF11_06625 [Thelohanellus kitauei]|uniref:EGF-like domain-containing protein n=1 Tax=Thelohanellus kitauei TaxID=669202 RepID=A0A0C2JYQ7_THEKT|nr:hypothetical protein RF11_06625 [Thelohanellus kitauei]